MVDLSLFQKLLVSARSEKFSSARAFFQDRSLTFSYGTYILFERGERLPTAPQLAELIETLEIPSENILLAWAASQFEQPRLRVVFEGKIKADRGRAHQTVTQTSRDLPSPNLDNTWVLNKRDIDEILKFPWLWDALSDIITSYPVGIATATLSSRYGISESELTGKYLARWIGSGEITLSEGQISPIGPYMHLPVTTQSDQIKLASLKRIADRLTSDGSTLLTKHILRIKLEDEIAAEWTYKLNQLFVEIKASSAKGSENKRLYEFVLLFDRRE